MLSIFLCTLRTGVHCRSLTLRLERVVTRRFSRLLWREVGIVGRCTLRAGVHCRSLTLHLGRVVTRRLSRLLWREVGICRALYAEGGRIPSVAYASPGNA